MRISVICKTNEWQVQQLISEAASIGVDLEVCDIEKIEEVAKLEDVVLWRSSSLGATPQRKIVMDEIMRSGRPLINRCLAIYPEGTDKFFQQLHVKNNTDTINTIETFVFEEMEELIKFVETGKLKLPFIRKPKKGSKGEGVELISNKNELQSLAQVEGFVYQNFIKNSGDFRVFILGGKVLGVIKRIAKSGSFLNNISKGGRAEMVTDPQVLKKLHHIGTTVASMFSLTLCGVDVIFDENEKIYRFLEVNTVPQWKGFQTETGINVAREIIEFCKDLHQRKEDADYSQLILRHYMSNEPYLWDKKFHFFSRMFLWSSAPVFREKLEQLRTAYLGNNDDELKNLLTNILKRPAPRGEKMVAKELRIKYFEKYPLLDGYLGLLFKNLFAKTLYEQDIRSQILKNVSDQQFLELKKALEDDIEAVMALSTHAINYMFILREYLGSDKCQINIDKLYEIGQLYSADQSRQSMELCIYFYTHCVIGASGFYSHKISNLELPVCLKMLESIDVLILGRAEEISLDNKFEFLVCARMCGFNAHSEKLILDEAKKSLSSEGNFIIDKFNAKSSLDARNDLVGSEHRNVLYLMSQTPWARA